jgi:5-methylcytosine-specific restriction endonuclease McrA
MSNHNMGGSIRRRRKRRLYETYGAGCIYCSQKFPIDQLTLEHLVPRSLGGANALYNLRLACLPCNSRRGAALIR